MFAILIRAMFAVLCALVAIVTGIRMFYLILTSSQTVGSEVLTIIAAMLFYAFSMPTGEDMQALDEFVKSKNEEKKK